MAKRYSKQWEPGGDISAEDYVQAAQDHAVALAGLYTSGHFAAVIYLSGLAAECLFRAFRARKGLPFTSEHKLSVLAEEAGFPEVIPAGHREQFDAALADLILRWRNSHRFRSNLALRRFLRDLKLYRGIKGDFLKENARILSTGAFNLVGVGVVKWR